jgi:hypothetical protein
MKERTPKHLRCTIGACPGVYEVEGGNLLVIGKKITSELKDKIKSKVGDDEFAVLISRDFFVELQKK